MRFQLFGGRQRSPQIGAIKRLFGDSAEWRAGVYTTRDSIESRPFSFMRVVPFDLKTGDRVGEYRVGFWPAEKRRVQTAAYQNPEGFIRVTPENQQTPVSEHFRLRDFLTHDQHDVWPKYLVLSEKLVDKLELIIQELNAIGTARSRLAVLSGFRTPSYNQQGVGRRGGRAPDSRHQFGDAADVYVDRDGDGRMDDLNGDGRIDVRDAEYLVRVVDRIESRFPDLIGGVGVYRAKGPSGPFVHVDVRGSRARWRV